jgi:hypothetical protein
MLEGVDLAPGGRWNYCRLTCLCFSFWLRLAKKGLQDIIPIAQAGQETS